MKMTPPEPSPGGTKVGVLFLFAIITVAAVIAVPRMRAKAEFKEEELCRSNLRGLDGAIQNWALENRAEDDAWVTYSTIRPYLKADVSCPSARGELRGLSANYSLTTVKEKPRCLIRPKTHTLPDY